MCRTLLCRVYTTLSLLALIGCSASLPIDTPSQAEKDASINVRRGLNLIDASFATAIHDREPARVSSSLPRPTSEDGELSFWMELTCTGLCNQRLAEAGKVTVILEWYKEDRGILLKQASTPLEVKGPRWRTWGTKRISAGNWVAVVRMDDSWLCLREQCYFSIAVEP